MNFSLPVILNRLNLPNRSGLQNTARYRRHFIMLVNRSMFKMVTASGHSSLTDRDSKQAGVYRFETFEEMERVIDQKKGGRRACKVEGIIAAISRERSFLLLNILGEKIRTKKEEKIKLQILDLKKKDVVVTSLKSMAGVINLCNALLVEHIHANLLSVDGLNSSHPSPYRALYDIKRIQYDAARSETSAFPVGLRVIPLNERNNREVTAHYDPWWILPLMTTENSVMSELSVVQLLGGKMRSTFILPGCRVLSNQTLKSHPMFQMVPGKDPMPDLAAVYTDDTIEPDVLNLLAPVFLAGEIKRYQTGEMKLKKAEGSANTKTPIYPSQIQPALYQTLILLIIFYMMDNKPSQPLPDTYFVYGLYFDENLIVVYAHFPFLDADEDKETWRFAQVRLATWKIPVFGEPETGLNGRPKGRSSHRERENASLRFQNMIGLITVRARAAVLKDYFVETDVDKWKEVVKVLPVVRKA